MWAFIEAAGELQNNLSFALFGFGFSICVAFGFGLGQLQRRFCYEFSRKSWPVPILHGVLA